MTTPTPRSTPATGAPKDINTASLEELTGAGKLSRPVAEALLEARPFNSWAELSDRVPELEAAQAEALRSRNFRLEGGGETGESGSGPIGEPGSGGSGGAPGGNLGRA